MGMDYGELIKKADREYTILQMYDILHTFYLFEIIYTDLDLFNM